MLFEFSWHNGSELKRFATCDPMIGEIFMNSVDCFPKLTSAIREQYKCLFTESGSFEKFLKETRESRPPGMIATGIRELSLQMINDARS